MWRREYDYIQAKKIIAVAPQDGPTQQNCRDMSRAKGQPQPYELLITPLVTGL
jgi:hypothetical protein